MSASRHPIALRLERQVGEGTRLLATVMALPLLDGIFAALVLAGAVSTVMGMLEVGLLIFGGSATVAVVLAEMEGSRTDQVKKVLFVGLLLVPLAALQAAVAPTVESVLVMPVFERFAALVIVAIAAKTASALIGEYLPSPGVIIGLGMIASFRPGGFEFALVAEPMYVAYGTGAAAVGVAVALAVAVFAPWLRGNVDIDRFRFGSAVALGVLPLTILGLIPSEAPLALAVLGVTALLAFDPDGVEDASAPGDGSEGEQAAADGGARDSDGFEVALEDAEAAVDGVGPDDGAPGVSDGDRAPWL
jgi:hypothetical protein